MKKIPFKTIKISKENITIYNNISEEDINIILDFVNNISKQTLFNINTNRYIGKFKYIGGGAYGKVFKYKNYAVKIFFESIGYNDDGFNLSKLQHLETYPNIYIDCEDFIVTEYIKGKLLNEYTDINKLVNSLNENCLNILYKDLTETLNNKIKPDDVSKFNVIITKEGYLKIIDLGNFTTIRNELSNRKINLNATNICEKIKLYRFINNECLYDSIDIINKIRQELKQKIKKVS